MGCPLMIYKPIRGVLIIVVLIINLTACTDYASVVEEKDANSEEIRIGVLLYRFDDKFIASFKESILREVEGINAEYDSNLNVDIYDGKNQQDIQTDQIKDLIAQSYDALAINLVDRNIAASIIDIAKQADIPIVFFNRQPVEVDMARWDKVYYVGARAEESGRIQGEIAAELWLGNNQWDKNKDGIMQYVLLEGQPDHQDAILRTKYAINQVMENGIQVEELVSDTANWQRSEARDKMENWLDFFGDNIEFIFSNNDTMALGAIDAMKTRETLLPIVGVDAIPTALTALENKELLGTVKNDHEQQAKMVMTLIHSLVKGENPADHIEDLDKGTYLWIPYKKVVLEPK